MSRSRDLPRCPAVPSPLPSYFSFRFRIPETDNSLFTCVCVLPRISAISEGRIPKPYSTSICCRSNMGRSSLGRSNKAITTFNRRFADSKEAGFKYISAFVNTLYVWECTFCSIIDCEHGWPIRGIFMPPTADKQLEDIRRLLVLLLMKLGSPSEEIALALNVDSSAVRKLIPGRKVKKIISEREA
jgi:hypothetical protein